MPALWVKVAPLGEPESLSEKWQRQAFSLPSSNLDGNCHNQIHCVLTRMSQALGEVLAFLHVNSYRNLSIHPHTVLAFFVRLFVCFVLFLA